MHKYKVRYTHVNSQLSGARVQNLYKYLDEQFYDFEEEEEIAEYFNNLAPKKLVMWIFHKFYLLLLGTSSKHLKMISRKTHSRHTYFFLDVPSTDEN